MRIEQKYLDEFSYFGDRVYLDCSSMGMQPQRTRDAGKHYLDAFFGSLWQDPELQGEVIRPKARAEAARLIGADPADVFFTRCTTDGNNLLAAGYPLQPGDEVLVSNQDHPSVFLPWTLRQEQGIKLTVVKGCSGIVSAEEMISAFTDRTKVVSVSMVQSSSGYAADLEKLGRACRERGILLSVDAVQAAGRLPIDVERMNIDVLSASSFKGLMGIMGAGFCWCRRPVMDRITPPVICENIDMDHYDLSEDFSVLPVPGLSAGAARMETGTTNNLGILMMSESLSMLNEIGISSIAEQIRTVETYYRSCLKRSGLNIRMLGSSGPAHWSGTVSFRYDIARMQDLREALAGSGIIATVRDYFRVGIHFYNTAEQIGRLMSVLKSVLR